MTPSVPWLRRIVDEATRHNAPGSWTYARCSLSGYPDGSGERWIAQASWRKGLGRATRYITFQAPTADLAAHGLCVVLGKPFAGWARHR